MTDKVDGTTSGDLNLRQLVTGGNSGNVDSGANGTAGNAFSSLSKTTSSSQEIMCGSSRRVTALSGSGSRNESGTRQIGRGSDY